ncbi:MAG: magnesium transporter [Candidatus Woesearchaeota archaeon]
MNNKLISETINKLHSDFDKNFDLFMNLEDNIKNSVLVQCNAKIQIKIFDKLNIKESIKLLKYLDPDEITDILQNLSQFKQKKILKEFNEKLQEKIEFLLKFDAKTAAGIMSLDYLEVDKNITFKQLTNLIKKHELRTDKFPAILVVDEGRLIGEVKPHNLALSKYNEKIKKYITKVPSIRDDVHRNEVINIFKNNKHSKVVVLDEDLGILGIIYSDDILQIMHKTSAKHLGDFAGIMDEEDVLDTSFNKVKYRYKWLILNLFTGFLAASIVAIFENTIATFTLLAIYMPIIAGMGGNSGTQTLAIMVRGIALKELDWKNSRQVILKEVTAGCINGLINGVLVALIALWLHKSPLIGLILGISMIITLMAAAFFGSIIPLIMKKLGKDPATSATIFITTATDLFGFLIFLGLATMLLM